MVVLAEWRCEVCGEVGRSIRADQHGRAHDWCSTGSCTTLLQANGVGRWDTGAARIVYFSWQRDGDALLTGNNLPGALKQCAVLFNRHLFSRWGGRVLQDKQERWEILEEQGDAVRLRFGDSPWLVDLRRISE